ncbi:C4-dicarboxylate ABC transporter substrate-binding protein [Bradyrhizobium ottawaense]|nr:C4-dicarboxylate ABC transporter substrate-binding protein [Bradyrhizobium sp. CCBAU 45394]MDA9537354.1 C4-dicarboxylate ABC transporter substrate-binding protein [Bradyrhizobium sp. CCBAU 21362]PDT64711.1 C4-dicarboxylate ABC transporter substrate-binding protein [Bradyrhizobium ottawaense]
MMKSWLTKYLLVSVQVFSLAGPALAQTTLKYAFVNPMNSHFGAAATAFKESVEADSQRRIKIDIFPGGTLGGEREIVESLQLGTVDLAMTSTSVVGNFVPELLVFDVPFLFRDASHARHVVDGPIGQQILAKFPARGLLGLGYGENGFRHLTNNKREVREPSQIAGLTIRTMENPIHLAAFSQLGARPTPIPWAELYTALQGGVVDGEENPLSNILTAKLFQVQKYLSLTGHVYAPTVITIAPSTWSKLSAPDKKIIKDAAAKAIVAQRQKVEELESDGVKELTKAGMVVNDVDKPRFLEVLKPAYVKFSQQFGEKTLEAIRETK